MRLYLYRQFIGDIVILKIDKIRYAQIHAYSIQLVIVDLSHVRCKSIPSYDNHIMIENEPTQISHLNIMQN